MRFTPNGCVMYDIGEKVYVKAAHNFYTVNGTETRRRWLVELSGGERWIRNCDIDHERTARAAFGGGNP